MDWATRPRTDLAGLAAIVAGAGPTVVLVHGVGLRAEAWGAQIDALAAAGFRVIAPDMPGHGGTPACAGMPDLAGFAARLAPALAAPAMVAGHSMGAMVALELARQHPDRVRGIAACNAIYRRSAAARAAVCARAGTLDGVSAPDPAGPLARWFAASSPERDACERWLRAADPAGYRAAYRLFAAADGPADATLAALPCPALFMTGGDEPNSTPAMSEAMARLAPQGRAVVVAGAAHMMPMTHADRVSAELNAFARTCHAPDRRT